MQQYSDAQVVQSWNRNAEAWAHAVRARLIESRRLITDQAIIDAVLDIAPRSVLDLGCGEGWLVRALAARGVQATGVDGVPALVERAREAGGSFQLASYEDIIAGQLPLRCHTVACNFSLLGKDAVEHLLASLVTVVEEDGRLVVQTVHPVMACLRRWLAPGGLEGL